VIALYFGQIHTRAVASPTHRVVEKKISDGTKYLSSFLKFEVKKRRKSI